MSVSQKKLVAGLSMAIAIALAIVLSTTERPSRPSAARVRDFRASILEEGRPRWQAALRGGQVDELRSASTLELAYLTALDASAEGASPAAEFLARALELPGNPSRGLVLEEIESIAYRDIRLGRNARPTGARRKLFRALLEHAPEELARLERDNPGSALLRYLKSA